MASFNATTRTESGRPSTSRHLDDLKTPLYPLPELRSSSAWTERHRRRNDYEVANSDNSSDENYNTSSDSEVVARSSLTALEGATKPVDIVEDPQTVRFHGKTSVHVLLDAARKYRQMLLKQSGDPSVHIPMDMDQAPSRELLSRRRRQYWQSPKVSACYTYVDDI